jgi:hypothetical protein
MRPQVFVAVLLVGNTNLSAFKKEKSNLSESIITRFKVWSAPISAQFFALVAWFSAVTGTDLVQ